MKNESRAGWVKIGSMWYRAPGREQPSPPAPDLPDWIEENETAGDVAEPEEAPPAELPDWLEDERDESGPVNNCSQTEAPAVVTDPADRLHYALVYVALFLTIFLGLLWLLLAYAPAPA